MNKDQWSLWVIQNRLIHLDIHLGRLFWHPFDTTWILEDTIFPSNSFIASNRATREKVSSKYSPFIWVYPLAAREALFLVTLTFFDSILEMKHMLDDTSLDLVVTPSFWSPIMFFVRWYFWIVVDDPLFTRKLSNTPSEFSSSGDKMMFSPLSGTSVMTLYSEVVAPIFLH